MVPLLWWQLLGWLAGTAVVSVVLGWFWRGKYWSKPPDSLVTSADRASWQTSLESLKGRVEAEAARRVAAEKAFEDAQSQAAKFCLLLDRHTTEIRNLADELADKNQALAENATLIVELRAEAGRLAAECAGLSPESSHGAGFTETGPRLVDIDSKLRLAGPQLTRRPAAPWQQLLPTHDRDDLKKIYGVGPVLERKLNELGVYFFREIALWSEEDIARYEGQIKDFRQRIERDNWVASARAEHFKKYGEELFKASASGG